MVIFHSYVSLPGRVHLGIGQDAGPPFIQSISKVSILIGVPQETRAPSKDIPSGKLT